MANGDWRETWEQHAEHERGALGETPVSELIERVRARRFGGYYGIWYALAERAKLNEVGWVLFSVLESDADYLDRYHCAAALLRLLGEKRWQAVDLSAEWGRAKNLDPVERVLEQRIGARQ
ncbi:MAG TPA: hypothetical protein VF656_03745 [Pyrinomonadaceae bacterium]|jgi:hypothetical protein